MYGGACGGVSPGESLGLVPVWPLKWVEAACLTPRYWYSYFPIVSCSLLAVNYALGVLKEAGKG